DGTSQTFLFGERYHRDSEYDRLQPKLAPSIAPLDQIGKWGFVAGAGGVMTNLTLHTAAPINYGMPADGDSSALSNRLCAFGSGHPGGANFAFADCHVRFLRDSTPLEVLQALSTRAGGKPVSDGDY
ncbi:MAG TPA: DUF1559 domain-containing protein, partial [Gemmataceae bacterium]|nr:DUF1559 domain-containing protein [Gemmataceae bacterium]